MNARRIVIILALASAFFFTSSVCIGGGVRLEARAPNESEKTERADLDAIRIADWASLGALSLLLKEQGEEAEVGQRFQERFATIQRSVADNDVLNSRGGLMDVLHDSVLDWFPPEERAALGRKLGALTKTGSIESDHFFDLIGLGGFLVITDGQDRDVAETSRRIADHLRNNNGYDPEPLLQNLVTFIATLEPATKDTSKAIERIVKFFFSLRDCLRPSGENEVELITWLENTVLASLCHSRGLSDVCVEKKDELNRWAEQAGFPRCPP